MSVLCFLMFFFVLLFFFFFSFSRMRDSQTHKGRVSIFPQRNRIYHNGVKGTFMNSETHKLYFQDIDVVTSEDQRIVEQHSNSNSNSNSKHDNWQTSCEDSMGRNNCPLFLKGSQDMQDSILTEKVSQCTQLSSLEELSQHPGEIVCIWISMPLTQSFDTVARFFHIWHEFKRGEYGGVHEFGWENSWVVLLNTHAVSETILALKRVDPIPMTAFASASTSSSSNSLMASLSTQEKQHVHILSSKETNMNCHQICQSQVCE